MGVGTAIAVGAGVSAAASIGSAAMQSSAAEDAAETQANAANQATATQWKMYQQNRTDMLPWITQGQNAINRIGTGVQPGGEYDRFTMNDFVTDPGYSWRKQEGINALMASGAASGMYGSGNLGTALVNYGQNLASNEYQNAYGRWLDRYNRVAQLANIGQTQSQAVGSMGTSVANSISSNQIAAGNALAAGTLGSSNAWGNAMTGVMNQGMSGLGAYLNYNQNQKLLNTILDSSGGSSNSLYGYGGSGTDYGDYFDYMMY